MTFACWVSTSFLPRNVWSSLFSSKRGHLRAFLSNVGYWSPPRKDSYNSFVGLKASEFLSPSRYYNAKLTLILFKIGLSSSWVRSIISNICLNLRISIRKDNTFVSSYIIFTPTIYLRMYSHIQVYKKLKPDSFTLFGIIFIFILDFSTTYT